MICKDIADYIANPLGLGVRTGDTPDVFAYDLPADPMAAVAVIAYFGGAPYRTFCPAPQFERARFQVIVRAGAREGDDACWTRAYGIYTGLDKVVEETINSIRYLQIEALQPPFEMPRDQNEMLLVACNYEAWKELG